MSDLGKKLNVFPRFNESYIKCEFCDARFWIKSKYEKHLLSHKLDEISCKICDKTFVDDNALNKHNLDVHTDHVAIGKKEVPISQYVDIPSPIVRTRSTLDQLNSPNNDMNVKQVEMFSSTKLDVPSSRKQFTSSSWNKPFSFTVDSKSVFHSTPILSNDQRKSILKSNSKLVLGKKGSLAWKEPLVSTQPYFEISPDQKKSSSFRGTKRKLEINLCDEDEIGKKKKNVGNKFRFHATSDSLESRLLKLPPGLFVGNTEGQTKYVASRNENKDAVTKMSKPAWSVSCVKVTPKATANSCPKAKNINFNQIKLIQRCPDVTVENIGLKRVAHSCNSSTKPFQQESKSKRFKNLVVDSIPSISSVASKNGEKEDYKYQAKPVRNYSTSNNNELSNNKLSTISEGNFQVRSLNLSTSSFGPNCFVLDGRKLSTVGIASPEQLSPKQNKAVKINTGATEVAKHSSLQSTSAKLTTRLKDSNLFHDVKINSVERSKVLVVPPCQQKMDATSSVSRDLFETKAKYKLFHPHNPIVKLQRLPDKIYNEYITKESGSMRQSNLDLSLSKSPFQGNQPLQSLTFPVRCEGNIKNQAFGNSSLPPPKNFQKSNHLQLTDKPQALAHPKNTNVLTVTADVMKQLKMQSEQKNVRIIIPQKVLNQLHLTSLPVQNKTVQPVCAVQKVDLNTNKTGVPLNASSSNVSTTKFGSRVIFYGVEDMRRDEMKRKAEKEKKMAKEKLLKKMLAKYEEKEKKKQIKYKVKKFARFLDKNKHHFLEVQRKLLDDLESLSRNDMKLINEVKSLSDDDCAFKIATLLRNVGLEVIEEITFGIMGKSCNFEKADNQNFKACTELGGNKSQIISPKKDNNNKNENSTKAKIGLQKAIRKSPRHIKSSAANISESHLEYEKVGKTSPRKNNLKCPVSQVTKKSLCNDLQLVEKRRSVVNINATLNSTKKLSQDTSMYKVPLTENDSFKDSIMKYSSPSKGLYSRVKPTSKSNKKELKLSLTFLNKRSKVEKRMTVAKKKVEKYKSAEIQNKKEKTFNEDPFTDLSIITDEKYIIDCPCKTPFCNS